MPIPLAAVIAVMAVSAAAKAFGSMQQAKAMETAALMNKENSLKKAAYALDTGRAIETNLRFDIGGFKGAQVASIGSSGAVIGEGSAATAELSTEMKATLEVLTARNNATVEAWGHKVAVQQHQYEADVAKYMGGVGAFTSLLGGGAQAMGAARST